jgi:hypothetical protein
MMNTITHSDIRYLTHVLFGTSPVSEDAILAKLQQLGYLHDTKALITFMTTYLIQSFFYLSNSPHMGRWESMALQGPTGKMFHDQLGARVGFSFLLE